MKIWTLIENTTCRNDLQAEHGFSLYIETGAHKILFDAGQSESFADNAEKMGIDLRLVDLAVLSHGHYDHGGGLLRFMEINKTAPIYINHNAFMDHYNSAGKYNGLDPKLAESGRIILTDDFTVLDKGISLHTCNELQLHSPIQHCGLSVRENGALKADDFRHEQYLLIEEDKKKILISGCSHKGIVNISQWFQPDVLIGGFHLVKLDPEKEGADELRLVADLLMKYPTVYYTGHCTGIAQYEFLHNIMGDQLHYLSTGKMISIL